MRRIILLSAAILSIIDQVLKYLVSGALELGDSITIIPNLAYLERIHNTGIALGMMEGERIFSIIMTSLLMAAFLYIVLTKKIAHRLFTIASALIIGGGIGNLIDRIFLGYVVDYFRVSFFPPTCNFADYCVTAGTTILIIYLLFYSDYLVTRKRPKEENANGGDKNGET